MFTEEHTWTDAELQQLANRITYKPGYELWLRRHPAMPIVSLKVRATVSDSRSPANLFELIFEQTLPPRLSEAGLLFYIGRALHTLETHEADEWFKLDGQMVHDPHEAVI